MRRKSVVLQLAVLISSLAGTSALSAQACLDQSARPAVCNIEVLAAGPGERFRAVEVRRPIALTVGQTMALQFDAYDQRGRLFPVERLSYGYEAENCGGLLKIDQTKSDQFEVAAGRGRGDCRVSFWVPGNLNLEWQLVFRTEARHRTGYSRPEAEYIGAKLYRALLGREADSGGLAGTVSEIQRGRLDKRVDDMIKSLEFRGRLQTMNAAAFLEQLYQGLFDRSADSSGVRAFLGQIEKRKIRQVVMELVVSEEFEDQLVRVPSK